MALSFNGNTPRNITFNGFDVRKLIYNNDVVWLRLPSEFQEVEYLETLDSQFFEVNYICNNKTRIFIKFKTPASIPTNRSVTLFYSGSGSENYGFAMASSAASGKFRVFYKGVYNGDYLNGNTEYVLDFNKNKIYLDNVLLYTFPANIFTVPYRLPFFAQYYNNTNPINYSPSGTRIYNIKIYDNDVLVCYLIPCYRKSDNKAGMYDILNGDFYTNLKSGNFNVGSDIT